MCVVVDQLHCCHLVVAVEGEMVGEPWLCLLLSYSKVAGRFVKDSGE